jgi:hypothetical protein
MQSFMFKLKLVRKQNCQYEMVLAGKLFLTKKCISTIVIG